MTNDERLKTIDEALRILDVFGKYENPDGVPAYEKHAFQMLRDFLVTQEATIAIAARQLSGELFTPGHERAADERATLVANPLQLAAAFQEYEAGLRRAWASGTPVSVAEMLSARAPLLALLQLDLPKRHRDEPSDALRRIAGVIMSVLPGERVDAVSYVDGFAYFDWMRVRWRASEQGDVEEALSSGFLRVPYEAMLMGKLFKSQLALRDSMP